MIQSFKNIWSIPDLRRRILYTLGLLAVYRVGGHIPTPGIDNVALLRLFESQAGSILGSSTLSRGQPGGSRSSRWASCPHHGLDHPAASDRDLAHLRRSARRGGRAQKITQYTRYGTVLLSLIQSFGIARFLELSNSGGVGSIVPNPAGASAS
jgi:preprotein translocase subunit SecY